MVPTPTPSPHRNSWNPLIISLVGAVCTIFLFLSYCNILRRHCFMLNRAMTRDLNQRRLLNNTNPDDPSLQSQSRGLDTTVMLALPAIQFGKSEGDIEYGSDMDCAICLGKFEEGDWLRLLPSCAHIFHISCIDTWFRSHTSCPLCRENVVTNFESPHCYSNSTYTLMETLEREDAHRARVEGLRVFEIPHLSV